MRIEQEYPDLNFFEEGEALVIRGSFPVRYEGRTVDRYSIEVVVPEDRSDSIPRLREIGGRIPEVPDSHNSEEGICALLPDERWEGFPEGSTLLDFLKGPVHSFLLRNSLIEVGEKWPHGERAHGVDGVVEYYAELVGTDDRETIGRYLEVLSKREFKGHLPCPCGSEKRIRRCHGGLILDLRKRISPPTARRSIALIRGR